MKNLLHTRSVNEYTKVFRSIVLELGDRAFDQKALIFAYIDEFKEDIKT